METEWWINRPASYKLTGNELHMRYLTIPREYEPIKFYLYGYPLDAYTGQELLNEFANIRNHNELKDYLNKRGHPYRQFRLGDQGKLIVEPVQQILEAATCLRWLSCVLDALQNDPYRLRKWCQILSDSSKDPTTNHFTLRPTEYEIEIEYRNWNGVCDIYGCSFERDVIVEQICTIEEWKAEQAYTQLQWLNKQPRYLEIIGRRYLSAAISSLVKGIGLHLVPFHSGFD